MIFTNNYKIKIPNLMVLRNDKTILKTYDIIRFRSYQYPPASSLDISANFYDNLILPSEVDIYDSIAGDYDVTITDEYISEILNIQSDFYDTTTSSSEVDVYDTLVGNYDLTFVDSISSVNILLSANFYDTTTSSSEVDVYDTTIGNVDITITDEYVNLNQYSSIYASTISRLSDRFINTQIYTGGRESITNTIPYTSGIGIDVSFYGTYTEDQMNSIVFYNSATNESVNIDVNFTEDGILSVLYFNDFGDSEVIYYTSGLPSNVNIRAVAGYGRVLINITDFTGTTFVETSYTDTLMFDSLEMIVAGNGNSTDRYATIPEIEYNISESDFSNYINNLVIQSVSDQW